jgi:hypothetical protein
MNSVPARMAEVLTELYKVCEKPTDTSDREGSPGVLKTARKNPLEALPILGGGCECVI